MLMKHALFKRKGEFDRMVTAKKTSDFIRSLLTDKRAQTELTKLQLQMAIEHTKNYN